MGAGPVPIETAATPRPTTLIETLGIQEVEFTMPTAPLMINNEPYALQADSERLKNALCHVRRASLLGTGERELRGVRLVLGESLPESVLKDPLPKRHLYEPEDASVEVEIPSLIVSPKPTAKVVELIQRSINIDLEQGLNQSIYMRDSYAYRWACVKYGMIALGGVGIAAGVALGENHTAPAVAGEASFGALTGMAASFAPLYIKAMIQDSHMFGKKTWKENKLDKAARRAAKSPDNLQKWFAKPIITLVKEEEPTELETA